MIILADRIVIRCIELKFKTCRLLVAMKAIDGEMRIMTGRSGKRIRNIRKFRNGDEKRERNRRHSTLQINDSYLLYSSHHITDFSYKISFW